MNKIKKSKFLVGEMVKNLYTNKKGKILRVKIIGDEFNYVYVYLIKYNIFNKKWAFESSITNLN